MSVYLGSAKLGDIYLGSTRIAQAYLGSTKVYERNSVPIIGSRVVRFGFNWIMDPSEFSYYQQGGVTITQVSASGGASVYDFDFTNWTYSTSYDSVFMASILPSSWNASGHTIDIIAIDFSGTSSAINMFKGLQTLKSIGVFYNVGNSLGMLDDMFNGCINVSSGIVRAYNSLSAVNPSNHNDTFCNCGSNTTTGRAELAQIPYTWK